MHWWLPGAYASGPALLCWILARLPEGVVSHAVTLLMLRASLNRLGDTIFVLGWLVSAIWLWRIRERPAKSQAASQAGSPLAKPTTAKTDSKPEQGPLAG